MGRKEHDEARKYFGIENFPDLVLHHKDTLLKYNDLEKYNQWNPEDLVVLTRAEHSKLHMSGVNRTEETKNKISNAQLGTKRSNIAKQHMSEAAIKKSIYCIELDTIFNSIKEASEQLEISRGNICSCVKGNRQTAGGYHWKYVNN